MRRFVLAALLLCFTPFGNAATYIVRPLVESQDAEITVRLDRGVAKNFYIPAWSPGDYELFNYGKNVTEISFSLKGKGVEFQRGEDVNKWFVPSGADQVVYRMKPSRGNFTVNLRVRPEEMFMSGSAVLGWFEGHQKEKQTLLIKPQQPGMAAECNLDRMKNAPSGHIGFIAPNFDELVDSPVSVGMKIRTQSYDHRGKKIVIVAIGKNDTYNSDAFVSVTKAVAEQCFLLFGELPYPRYVYHFDFDGGGGGLEHSNSTRIGTSSRSIGPPSGTIFHEFFHAFNVKRIRPKVLGPFDYTKPAITGSIWWLEGVTDYYAEILQVRAGLKTKEQMLAGFSGTFQSLSRNPASTKYSADEISRRVWETRGSFGFDNLSYYTKGRAIGFCLDLAIRSYSKGKYSLDNVMVSLYKECRNGKPGFAEGRIRELCIKFGTPKIASLYDMCVHQPVNLPLGEVLPLGGLKLDGFEIIPDDAVSPESKTVWAKFPYPVKG